MPAIPKPKFMKPLALHELWFWYGGHYIKTKVHETARASRIFRRYVHRDSPNRRNDQFREEESETQANRDRREIMDEYDRQHKAERSKKAEYDDRYSCLPDISCPFKNVVAEYSADRISDDTCEEHTGREQRRFFDVELIFMQKKGRQPVEIKPQNPTVAKVGQRHGHDASQQGAPRHSFSRRSNC